jgi:hypothetical protein
MIALVAGRRGIGYYEYTYGGNKIRDRGPALRDSYQSPSGSSIYFQSRRSSSWWVLQLYIHTSFMQDPRAMPSPSAEPLSALAHYSGCEVSGKARWYLLSRPSIDTTHPGPSMLSVHCQWVKSIADRVERIFRTPISYMIRHYATSVTVCHIFFDQLREEDWVL